MEPSASSAEAVSAFQVTLGDFSGPLDLLCHLVESRAMDVSKIKLTDVLTQYVSYMVMAKKATLAELGLAEPTAKDKGKLMKALMPKVKDKADGALVNRLVGTYLK